MINIEPEESTTILENIVNRINQEDSIWNNYFAYIYQNKRDANIQFKDTLGEYNLIHNEKITKELDSYL